MSQRGLDVLVVGGGPAGSAAAMTLARAGLNVGLVDATRDDPTPSPSPGKGRGPDPEAPSPPAPLPRGERGVDASYPPSLAGKGAGGLGPIDPTPSPSPGKGGEQADSSPPPLRGKGAGGLGSSPFKVGESLPPIATSLLHDLGLSLNEGPDDDGHLIALPGHAPAYGTQSAWGSPVLQTTDFIRDPHGPGWRLDRPRFDAQLRAAAVRAGAQVYRARVVAAERVGHHWRVALLGHDQTIDCHVERRSPEGCEGETSHSAGRDSSPTAPPAGTSQSDRRRFHLEARWLVDCTGRGSHIARRHGAQRHNSDHLIGVMAVYAPCAETGRPDEDNMTLVEAVEEGWWYTARLPTGRRVAVYHTDADLSTARQTRTPAGYAALLWQTRHIQARLPADLYRLVEGPRIVSANSARLDCPVGEGWLAVGDAALSFDPLASQGILTALYLGLHAAQALAAHLAGTPDPWEHYSQQVSSIYTAYQRHLHQYYSVERRWTNSPFWRRRQ